MGWRRPVLPSSCYVSAEADTRTQSLVDQWAAVLLGADKCGWAARLTEPGKINPGSMMEHA